MTHRLVCCAVVAVTAFVFFAGAGPVLAADEPGGAAGQAPPMPEPPAAVAEAAKKMAGTWKCEGTSHMMGTMPMAGTMTFKLDPSKMWIVGTWKSKKTKEMPSMTALEYRTFDASQNKWVQVGVDTMGGWGTATSAGPEQPGNVEWVGDFFMLGQGGKPMKVKTTETLVSPKEVRLVSTGSKDGGTTWQPMWEATCKK